VDSKAFDPKDVTTPIQLIAAWLLALLSFGALFLKGAHDIERPDWAPNLLILSAVAVIAVGSGLVFLLLTLFRPQTLSDDAFLKWQEAKEESFKGFKPERVQQGAAPDLAAAPAPGSAKTLEQWRQAEYDRTAGLFLTHSWRPSALADQEADITVRLRNTATDR
jgi:hypothetical protein